MTAKIIAPKPFPYLPVTPKSLGQRKPVWGHGTNDAIYLTSPKINGKQISCEVYRTWKSMFVRVYDPKYLAKMPSYADATICAEWMSFMSFRKWTLSQDWQGKQLDKDIRIPGNKEYSPRTCLYVDHHINCLLTDSKRSRGELPKGVAKCTGSKNFLAHYRRDNKLIHIGSFSTPEEASAAYSVERSFYIREKAMQQPEPIRSYLLQWT